MRRVTNDGGRREYAVRVPVTDVAAVEATVVRTNGDPVQHYLFGHTPTSVDYECRVGR